MQKRGAKGTVQFNNIQQIYAGKNESNNNNASETTIFLFDKEVIAPFAIIDFLLFRNL